MTVPTRKYEYCNHHHELSSEQELVDLGTGEFVADKKLLPLLKELNRLGLITRTHDFDKETGYCFLGILIDSVDVSFQDVNEIHSTRNQFNGRKELLLQWKTIPNAP